MKINDAILIREPAAVKFEDDDLDWLIGELDHAIDEARKRGSFLYICDPDLGQAALDFFVRFHQRLIWGQEKFDFDVIRLSEEGRESVWRDRVRKKWASLADSGDEPPWSKP